MGKLSGWKWLSLKFSNLSRRKQLRGRSRSGFISKTVRISPKGRNLFFTCMTASMSVLFRGVLGKLLITLSQPQKAVSI